MWHLSRKGGDHAARLFWWSSHVDSAQLWRREKTRAMQYLSLTSSFLTLLHKRMNRGSCRDFVWLVTFTLWSESVIGGYVCETPWEAKPIDFEIVSMSLDLSYLLAEIIHVMTCERGGGVGGGRVWESHLQWSSPTMDAILSVCVSWVQLWFPVTSHHSQLSCIGPFFFECL